MCMIYLNINIIITSTSAKKFKIDPNEKINYIDSIINPIITESYYFVRAK